MIDFLPIFQRLPKFFEQRETSITYGKPFDVYAKMPSLNASMLKKPTAAEMLHEMRSPEERQCDMTESRATSFAQGEAIHKAILEPHLFEDGVNEYFQYSPTKGLVTKAAIEAFNADPTRPLVTEDIIDTAKRVRDAVFAHHFAAQLLAAPGHNEATVETWDEEVQVMRKCRFDRLPGKGASFILDIKSTADSLADWTVLKNVKKFGYHMQAKWYLDTLRMATGDDRQQFFFIFVTTSEPHMCRVFEVNVDMPEPSLLTSAAAINAHRTAMFCNSAREFIQRVQEKHKNPLGAWEAFENEGPQLLDAIGSYNK